MIDLMSDYLKNNLIERECYSTKHKNVAFVQENL